ncbi:hypothetical protein DIPPA_11623 [Diplonema papillatum]|nr:hypothetical protein DIPPA_11623 [Diplonema papillatum]
MGMAGGLGVKGIDGGGEAEYGIRVENGRAAGLFAAASSLHARAAAQLRA